MFDVEQNLWKAHVLLISVHLAVTGLCLAYLLLAEGEQFRKLKFHQKMFALIEWVTIVPFTVSMGFGFILFGGVGLLWLYQMHGG